MSAVTDSLSRLENEHQRILDELHELRQKSTLDDGDLDILDDLEGIVQDWDQIFGGEVASDTIGRKVNDVQRSADKLQAVKELDLLVDPLRHYVIGLEKYKREEWRDTVTRSAMVVERIVEEVAIELGEQEEVNNMTMENAFGYIQNILETSCVARSQQFTGLMRDIYTIRDDRGPHDVPAAEVFQAKHSISALMTTYYRYLQIISEIGSPQLPEEDIVDFTNLLDLILELNPRMVMGEGGQEPSLADVIVKDLYKNGFFREPRSASDVAERLMSKRYNPPKSTLHNNLRRLTGEILTRREMDGTYHYMEKVPPGKYFD